MAQLLAVVFIWIKVLLLRWTAGEISGNHVINPTSQTNGGGIAVGGTFTLNSGKISDNIKDGSWNGGSSSICKWDITMNGGEVSGKY